MTPGTENGDRLEGWKDIANFFGKGVRTVQIWEKEFGLPVHREMKRVWAVRGELERWRQTHQVLAAAEEIVETPIEPPAELPPPAEPLRFWANTRGRAAIGLSLCLLLALGAVAYARWVPGPAVDYTVQGKVLRLVDAQQRVSWQWELPTAPPEEVRGGTQQLPDLRGLFLDVDGDGEREFLYRYWPADLGKQGSVLYCFDQRGKLRWTYEAGRALELENGKKLGGTYVLRHVAVLAHPRPDGGRIVISSHHGWDWPHQIAVLTAAGQLVEEYWHPGWIFSMDVADLDGDGADEVLLGGVNNGYGDGEEHGATLVVLDARALGGQGRVPKGYGMQVAGLKKGVEKRVLLFPEFVKSANPNYYEHVERIQVSREREVHLVLSQGFGAGIFAWPYAHLELGPGLEVKRILPGAQLAEQLESQLPVAERGPAGRGRLYRQVIGQVRELGRE